MRVSDEICDDGSDDGEGCEIGCQAFAAGWLCSGGTPSGPDSCFEICGDGLIVGAEECDNNPFYSVSDGCDINCMEITGWDCTGMTPGLSCAPICGDSMVVYSE